MTFKAWKSQLAIELAAVFKMTEAEAATYIETTGDDAWLEPFNDGSTPKEAAGEEAWAAMWS